MARRATPLQTDRSQPRTSPRGPAAALRGRGYRLTPQRQFVLEAVAQAGHATPEQILSAVRSTFTSVNISTVYRTLDLLEELGLVRHTHLGHGAPGYSLTGGEEHLHLVCRRCTSVQQVPAHQVAGIAAGLMADHGFAVDVGHVALHGLCGRCMAAGPD